MTMMRRGPRGWPLAPAWTDEHVDRLFRGMFRDFFGDASTLGRFFDGDSLMRLEEYVDGDDCVIRAELPGMDPEKDIEITVADGMLHLSAHREERKESEQPERRYRSEFRYGRFERSVRLPRGTTKGDIKASYTNGILEVRVPTAAADEPEARRIAIEKG